MFNCGSGAATIMSDYDFSDGLWHKIEFSRHHTAGKLVIDGNYIKEGSSVGTAKSMVLIPPYYLGGVPLSISEIVSKNIVSILFREKTLFQMPPPPPPLIFHVGNNFEFLYNSLHGFFLKRSCRIVN